MGVVLKLGDPRIFTGSIHKKPRKSLSVVAHFAWNVDADGVKFPPRWIISEGLVTKWFGIHHWKLTWPAYFSMGWNETTN